MSKKLSELLQAATDTDDGFACPQEWIMMAQTLEQRAIPDYAEAHFRRLMEDEAEEADPETEPSFSWRKSWDWLEELRIDEAFKTARRASELWNHTHAIHTVEDRLEAVKRLLAPTPD